MQTNIEQTVIEKLRGLPQERQQKVLEFVEEMEREVRPRRPLHEIMDSIVAQSFGKVPPEDMAEMPPDASENLDYYLYGAPKK